MPAAFKIPVKTNPLYHLAITGPSRIDDHNDVTTLVTHRHGSARSIELPIIIWRNPPKPSEDMSLERQYQNQLTMDAKCEFAGGSDIQPDAGTAEICSLSDAIMSDRVPVTE
jgi:hypothetical protein